MTTGPPTPRSSEDIRGWIIDKLCSYARIERAEIRPDEPLIAHGVDSVQFVALIGELEDWLGCRFRDNPLIRFPTIDALSEFLARQIESGRRVIDPDDDERG